MTLQEVRFDEQGLIPAVVQDARTRQVLMLAYMNSQSLARTIETKETWFWSRSRNELWHKGQTSGNTQRVISIALDCDKDALIVMVEPAGPACHLGERSCFFNQVLKDAPAVADLGRVLEDLYILLETRKRDMPEGSYTSYLFQHGLDKILKKVGEEASEVIIAAKNPDRDAFTKEIADLIYHLMVLLVEQKTPLDNITNELVQRRSKNTRK